MNLLVIAATYPAYLVAMFFLKRDPSRPERNNMASTAFGFGLLSLVLTLVVGFIINYILYGSISSPEPLPDSATDLPLIGDVALHATIEEFTKFIPFAFYIYNRSYFSELTDGIIYFAIVGLTFGAIETFFYSLGGGGLITIVFRYGMGLFLHGALTSIVGYSLAKRKFGQNNVAQVGLIFLGVSLLHTLFNLGAYFSALNPFWALVSSAVSLIATSSMLWLFYRACKQDYKDGRTLLQPAT